MGSNLSSSNFSSRLCDSKGLGIFVYFVKKWGPLSHVNSNQRILDDTSGSLANLAT